MPSESGNIAPNFPTTLSVASPPEVPVTPMTRYTDGLQETSSNVMGFKCGGRLLKSNRVTAERLSSSGTHYRVRSKG